MTRLGSARLPLGWDRSVQAGKHAEPEDEFAPASPSRWRHQIRLAAVAARIKSVQSPLCAHTGAQKMG